MKIQTDLASSVGESFTDDIPTDSNHALTLLEQIEHNPDITQASLADQLGVAVGTVNWHLKRLIAKGYVKVKRAQRRKLRYIITPEGIALRTRLTVNYVETSMNLYRRTRGRVRELLTQVKQSGYNYVYIHGEGDIADICRLTCLEQGIHALDSTGSRNDIASSHDAMSSNDATDPATKNEIPCLELRGAKVFLKI